jgi:hypothetical protein
MKEDVRGVMDLRVGGANAEAVWANARAAAVRWIAVMVVAWDITCSAVFVTI